MDDSREKTGVQPKTVWDADKAKRWIKKKAIIYGILTLIAVLYLHNKNEEINNFVYSDNHRYTVVYSYGINGHSEFTYWSDGYCELKIYPGLGHRFFDSLHLIDTDGDLKVDKVRKNGSELSCNTLQELGRRKFSYEKQKKLFHDADEMLQAEFDKHKINIDQWLKGGEDGKTGTK